MRTVSTIEEFKRHNEAELRKFMTYKTGIYNKDIHDDAIQTFYVKLIKTKALETFDPNYEGVPRRFDTYILTSFCQILPELKKQNHRTRYPMIARVNVGGHQDQRLVDIWELLNKEDSHSEFAISHKYNVSALDGRIDEDIELYVKDFIAYIKKTEPEKKARRMIVYLKYKLQGCNGTDISKMLKISNNMVKFVKKDLYDIFLDWNGQG